MCGDDPNVTCTCDNPNKYRYVESAIEIIDEKLFNGIKGRNSPMKSILKFKSLMIRRIGVHSSRQ